MPEHWCALRIRIAGPGDNMMFLLLCLSPALLCPVNLLFPLSTQRSNLSSFCWRML